MTFLYASSTFIYAKFEGFCGSIRFGGERAGVIFLFFHRGDRVKLLLLLSG